MARSSPRALATLVGVGLLPWVALLNAPGDTTFVMAWGLLNTNPWHVLVLPSYLAATQGFGSLPWSLQVWPLSVAFYAGALASAAAGALAGREDDEGNRPLLRVAHKPWRAVFFCSLRRRAELTQPVGKRLSVVGGGHHQQHKDLAFPHNDGRLVWGVEVRLVRAEQLLSFRNGRVLRLGSSRSHAQEEAKYGDENVSHGVIRRSVRRGRLRNRAR